jgi:Putative adhesin
MDTRTFFRTAALAAALTTLAATSAFALDQNFDRTLTTGSSPVLSVSTGSGYIHLRPGTDSQIHVIGHVHGNRGGSLFSGSADVDARVRQIAANPPIVQSGNEVTVGERHNNSDLYNNISIDYDITLPRAATLTAASGSGDIDIQDVGASLKADTGSGSVRAHGIQGAANLQTGSGKIELQQTGSGEVTARTGSGDIEVNGKPTTSWKLNTGSGSIHLNVGKVSFNVNASTGSGTTSQRPSTAVVLSSAPLPAPATFAFNSSLKPHGNIARSTATVERDITRFTLPHCFVGLALRCFSMASQYNCRS